MQIARRRVARFLTWVLSFSVGLLSVAGVIADDWPQWRGPHRDGKAAGFKAPENWPERLTEHREALLNYFRAKKAISGGVIEDLNNKVKVTFRKSYGFRTDKAREIALFHVLGKLPKPQLVHGFF